METDEFATIYEYKAMGTAASTSAPEASAATEGNKQLSERVELS